MTVSPEKIAEMLAACPFCGGEAILLKDHHKMGLYVACTKCFACTVTDLQPAAIEAWNTRAGLPSSTVARYGTALNGWLESMEHAGTWHDPTLKRLRENIGPILDEMIAAQLSGITEETSSAVLAERNRCIRIAARMEGGDPATRLAIAEEIRTGAHP